MEFGSSLDKVSFILMDEADFLLHNSGPSMVAWKAAEAFHTRTGRPFGVYGVTYGLYGIPEKETLSRTRFTSMRRPFCT